MSGYLPRNNKDSVVVDEHPGKGAGYFWEEDFLFPQLAERDGSVKTDTKVKADEAGVPESAKKSKGKKGVKNTPTPKSTRSARSKAPKDSKEDEEVEVCIH